MITFVTQNETHAYNFQPVINELINTSELNNNIMHSLHLDLITGLKTFQHISRINTKIIDVTSNLRFYDLSRLERFRWIFKNSRFLIENVSDTKILIIGTDGSLQRVMSNHVKQNGGKVIMISDGLVFPWSHNIFKKTCQKALKRFGDLASFFYLNQYVPAYTGHSNLDYVYVMNEEARDILIDQGIQCPVENIQLPRFDNYLRDYNKLKRNQNVSSKKNILYITGSYKWHGFFKEAELQKKSIEDLKTFALKHPDLNFRVRVHPRENRNEYINQQWPDNVILSMPEIETLEDLAWADVMINVNSTVSVEAQLVGVPVVIYTKHFGMPQKGSFFDKNEQFIKTDTLDRVINILNSNQNKEIQTKEHSDVPKITAKILEYFKEIS